MKKQNKYVPEYKKMGLTPAPIPQQRSVTVLPVGGDVQRLSNVARHSLAVNKPYQQINRFEPSVKEMENEQTQINEEQFEADRFGLPDDIPQGIENYSYLVVYKNDILGACPTKEELEEFLDSLYFGNDQQMENFDPDYLQIFRKIPLKIGVSVLS